MMCPAFTCLPAALPACYGDGFLVAHVYSQPKRIENARILVANTAMDTDKIKIYGARVRVDSMAKVSTAQGAVPC